MKEINLTTEELNSIKSLYNVTHISGEVSVYLLHDVILSYLIRDDYVVVNYKEKRKGSCLRACRGHPLYHVGTGFGTCTRLCP